MRRLTVSAPGKIILHGEHSVVYGYKAIACTLNLRCRVTLTESKSPEIILVKLEDLEQSQFTLTKHNFEKLKTLVGVSDNSVEGDVKSIQHFIKDMKLIDCTIIKTKESLLSTLTSILLLLLNVFSAFPSIDIVVYSELPVGAGLGSSASFAVVLAAAFLVKEGRLSDNSDLWTIEDKNAISSLAFKSETVMHGQPSGIDNTISVHGGAVVFQKGGDVKSLLSFPQMKAILVNTKVSRMTKTVVLELSERYNLEPTKYQNIFSQIENIVEKVVEQFDGHCDVNPESQQTLCQYIRLNQSLLTELAVSHEKIHEICHIFDSMDIPGKLTGAGAGGCVFGLLPVDMDPTKEAKLCLALEMRGFQVWLTSFGAKGVCIE